MNKRSNFAAGGKIGARARRAWICMRCGAWFEAKPARNTQCRGSNVKGHATDAQHFASQAEAGRYMELRLLERAGKISGLACQPRFELSVHGIVLGRYIADFSYRDHRAGKGKGVAVEDVKGGAVTEISDWKRRHAEAQYKTTISIVRR